MHKKKEKRTKKASRASTKDLKPVLEFPEIDLNKPLKNRFDPNDPVLFDLTLPTFEKDLIEQERERVDKLSEKKSKEELVIDRRKKEIKAKVKEILKIPPPAKYQPLEPVRKSDKLKEFEKQIRKEIPSIRWDSNDTEFGNLFINHPSQQQCVFDHNRTTQFELHPNEIYRL